MSTQPFIAQLRSRNTDWEGGFGSRGNFDPPDFANEAFCGNCVPGGTLIAYMIRRFGWPNDGSDDHKELCSWSITTPIEGVWLGVTPYMARDCGGNRPDNGNLHFSVRYSKEMEARFYEDARGDALRAANREILIKWWNEEGSTLYQIGIGMKSGDEDELIAKLPFGVEEDGVKDPSMVWGFWKVADPSKHQRILSDANENMCYLFDNIGMWKHACKALFDKHPGIPFKKYADFEHIPEDSEWMTEAKSAVKTAIFDLLRPVYIRDVAVSCFGHIDHGLAKEMYALWCEKFPQIPGEDGGTLMQDAGVFAGAGYSPEAWFTTVRKQKEPESKEIK